MILPDSSAEYLSGQHALNRFSSAGALPSCEQNECARIVPLQSSSLEDFEMEKKAASAVCPFWVAVASIHILKIVRIHLK